MTDKQVKWSTIPDYADHITLEYWIDCVKAFGFMNCDGFGRLATATQESNIEIYPSYIFRKKGYKFRVWTTHICWYNR